MEASTLAYGISGYGLRKAQLYCHLVEQRGSNRLFYVDNGAWYLLLAPNGIGEAYRSREHVSEGWPENVIPGCVILFKDVLPAHLSGYNEVLDYINTELQRPWLYRWQRSQALKWQLLRGRIARTYSAARHAWRGTTPPNQVSGLVWDNDCDDIAF